MALFPGYSWYEDLSISYNPVANEFAVAAAFALSLCALCAIQWVRESHLRRDVADLHRTVYLKLEMIQNLESQLKQAKEEITRLDNIRIELNGVIKTNNLETAFVCTNVDSAPRDIGVELFDETGALRNSVHAGNGAFLDVAPGQTKTVDTSARRHVL